MSTIEGKHWYRFNFLKSEKWDGIRLEVLVKFDAVCQICGLRDLANDVHHIWYDKCDEPGPDQLTVLCRECHDKIHVALEPSGAHTLGEKAAALEKFKSERSSIQATLYGVLSTKPCQACGASKAYKIDPLLRSIGPNGSGMSLCEDCQKRIYLQVPQSKSGSSAVWAKVKLIVGQIKTEAEAKRVELLIRENELFKHIPKCRGIYLQTCLLTSVFGHNSIAPVVETLGHQLDREVGWMARI